MHYGFLFLVQKPGRTVYKTWPFYSPHTNSVRDNYNVESAVLMVHAQCCVLKVGFGLILLLEV